MNNRAGSPRSFNTVKRSNRKERLYRRMQGRIVLLAICAVLILLMVVGLIFAVCQIANSFRGRTPANRDPDPNQPGNNTNVSGILYGSTAVENGQMYTGDLIVVNSGNAYRFPTIRVENQTDKQYDLKNLRELAGATEKYRFYDMYNRQNKMMPSAAKALTDMLSAYYDATGDRMLTIYDTYRTYDEQAKLNGTPAGYSEHHTALDVALRYFDGSDKYLAVSVANQPWIYSNCARYGFIQRYPVSQVGVTKVNGYEECFRYVGIPHAYYIQKNGICLEQYVELLKNNHFTTTGTDGVPLRLDVNGDGSNDYEIYYVAANTGSAVTAVPVPTNFAYTISGDNISGFIVTIDLNTPASN